MKKVGILIGGSSTVFDNLKKFNVAALDAADTKATNWVCAKVTTAGAVGDKVLSSA